MIEYSASQFCISIYHTFLPELALNLEANELKGGLNHVLIQGSHVSFEIS